VNGNPLAFLAFLVAERRRLGLAGFLCRTCSAAFRKARRRGDRAAAAYWYAETYRWFRADLASRRRRDGGCAGR
jgi:hypothetical protein